MSGLLRAAIFGMACLLGLAAGIAPSSAADYPNRPVKWLIGFGYFVFALAMWYYASFTLATDYCHEAWARALQGLGIATLFVPVSQLAYSNLPKHKNNKA